MNNYKNWIIEELESWKQTFNNQYPAHMESAIKEEKKVYADLQKLIDTFSKNDCTTEDYEKILFHIWQVKHEE